MMEKIRKVNSDNIQAVTRLQNKAVAGAKGVAYGKMRHSHWLSDERRI